jgi:hypothetical protein
MMGLVDCGSCGIESSSVLGLESLTRCSPQQALLLEVEFGLLLLDLKTILSNESSFLLALS